MSAAISRIRRTAAILALTLTTVVVATGTSAASSTGGPCRREPCSDEDVPPEAHHEAERIRDSLPARGQPLLRAREGVRLRLSGALGLQALYDQADPRPFEVALWIEGNPYYERVEGVVAGTPSLAVYDVILDAGSSAKEDPASAVPFDLNLSGRAGPA